MNRLHRESGEERPEPIPSHQYQRWHSSSSSSSTALWQWNENWWSSFFWWQSRLQLTAICCNRRVCEQNTLTRHIFQYLHACLTVSHVTLAQGVSARRVIHVSCACVSDFSSTLHFALFTVSLIFNFILLIFIFTFYVGLFGENSLFHYAQ